MAEVVQRPEFPEWARSNMMGLCWNEAFGVSKEPFVKLLLTHGDGLCLSDVAFQKFRAFTRNPQAQVVFLAKPLAERVRGRPAWRRLYEIEGLTEWA